MVQIQIEHSLRIVLCFIYLMIAVGSVCASEQNNESEEGALSDEPLLIPRAWDFGIGLGFGELSNPFIGADNVPAYVTVDLAIYGKRFFFDNGDLGFTLVNQPHMGLNLLATYNSDRIFHSFFNQVGFITSSVAGQGDPMLVAIESVDDVIAVTPIELPDRNFAINLGVELLLSGHWGELDIQLTQDVSSAHNGQELWAEFGRGWHWGDWSIRPSLGLTWKSSQLVDYYYSVRPEEDLLLSSIYSGESTVNLSAGISAAYKVTEKFSIVGSFKYERLGSNITSSPLIVEDSIRSVFIGSFYRF